VAAFTAATLATPVFAAQDGPERFGAEASYVVEVTVMGYASGADGGSVGSMTATGTQTHWGTVAADWNILPPGTRLQIEGLDDVIFVVEDRGGSVHGMLIDVWFPEYKAAFAFGTQKRRVAVLPPP
jgi:3D (Asp-Asp-Asp) domain-containing protein